MKFRRVLSGFLFGAGCALTFIGFISVILPRLSNRQMKLVIASFAAPSDNAVVSAVNRFMTFALANSWSVALLGLMTTAAGGLLLYCFQPRRTAKVRRPAAVHAPAQPAPPKPRAVRIPAAPVDQEAPNPFAVAAYQTQKQERSRPAAPIAFHAPPMLERNRIEPEPSAAYPAEETPSFVPSSEAYVLPAGGVKSGRSELDKTPYA